MRNLRFVVATLTLIAAPASKAQPQSSRDTINVLSTAAHFIKPGLAGCVRLESREARGSGAPLTGQPERTSASLLAAILGVPLAHSEDVIECGSHCKGTPADQVVILETPTFHGDSARVVITQLMRSPSPKARYIRSHFLRLVRQGTTWKVVRSTVSVT